MARPFLEVETRLLLPGSDAFLLALQAGSTIAEAVRACDRGDLRLQCLRMVSPCSSARISPSPSTTLASLTGRENVDGRV